MESAVYTDKVSGEKLNTHKAFKRSKRDFIDGTKRPIVGFSPMDDTMTVEPQHFTNIKILWKSDHTNSGVRGQESIKYPNGTDILPTEEKINELKAKIFKKLPG